MALASIALHAVAGVHPVSARSAAAMDLYLQVSVNGYDSQLIGHFVVLENGRLAATPEELKELGFRIDGLARNAGGLVELDRIADIRYRYDPARQSIDLTAPDSRRIARRYDAGPGGTRETESRDVPRAEPGAVLNYLVYGSSHAPLWDVWSMPKQGAVSASLDGRFFGPAGVLSQTGIVTANGDGLRDSIRLDTTWSFFSQKSLLTYRAGDVISGGLGWTRPLRLGGVQVQRSFSLRPDLITQPLANFSGTTAVPSTVDVFVNNVQTFSQRVAAGPFDIANIPVVSGPGLQRVVIRDVQGRETVSERPFYASAKLLKPELMDFSAEAGFRRVDYGLHSANYDPTPIASASLRRGLFDWLTVEGHAEGDGKLWNGGAGAAFRVGALGVATMAGSASRFGAMSGFQATASIEMALWRARVYARTQRTFGDYLDLASFGSGGLGLGVLNAGLFVNLRPPREVDQVAVSFPALFRRSALTLTATRFVDATYNRYDVLGATWSQPLRDNATLFATVFKDFSTSQNLGVFAGLSMTFDNGISAGITASSTDSGAAGGIEVYKPLRQAEGSYGWRLRDREGAYADRLAAASSRASAGRGTVTVQQIGSNVRGTGEFEGAIVALGGDVFLANRIDDAFAVVDVGAADVRVTNSNRLIGKTNARGRLLVANLQSFEPSEFGLDPRDLPVNADIPRTRAVVTPPGRGGAIVRFGVRNDLYSALVVLRDAKGAVLPVGLQGKVENSEQGFVVGYDGETFIKNEKQNVSLLVDRLEEPCRAAILLSRETPSATNRIEAVCR